MKFSWVQNSGAAPGKDRVRERGPQRKCAMLPKRRRVLKKIRPSPHNPRHYLLRAIAAPAFFSGRPLARFSEKMFDAAHQGVYAA